MVKAIEPDISRLRAEYERRQQRLKHSRIYSLFNPATLFIQQQRERAVLSLLKRHGIYQLSNKTILEVGCGKGDVLVELLSYGASVRNISGVDLLLDRLQEARQRLPCQALVCADGQHLPYREHTFDLVLQYTAFSSILDQQVKMNLASEMLRVLRPNGMILWYDFWLNPTNGQTRGIRPPEIRRLFPGCCYDFCRITLAPPLVRKLVPRLLLICYFLEYLQLFNTHYLVAIRPKGGH